MKKKSKKFTVFYTPHPIQHELVVEAKDMKEAVEKVKSLISKEVSSVEEGWEVF